MFLRRSRIAGGSWGVAGGPGRVWGGSRGSQGVLVSHPPPRGSLAAPSSAPSCPLSAPSSPPALPAPPVQSQSPPSPPSVPSQSPPPVPVHSQCGRGAGGGPGSGVSGWFRALPGVPEEGSGGPGGVPGGAGPGPLSGARRLRWDSTSGLTATSGPPLQASLLTPNSRGRKFRGSQERFRPPLPLPPLEIPKIPVFYLVLFRVLSKLRAAPRLPPRPRLPRAAVGGPALPLPPKRGEGSPKNPLEAPPRVGEGREKGGRGRGRSHAEPWSPTPPRRDPHTNLGEAPQFRGVSDPPQPPPIWGGGGRVTPQPQIWGLRDPNPHPSNLGQNGGSLAPHFGDLNP